MTIDSLTDCVSGGKGESKNWMPKHSKKKRKKSLKKMPRYPVSQKGVLLIVLRDLFKVIKMTNFSYDLFKVSKMFNLNFNLFKVSKMCVCFFMVKNCYKFSKMGIHGEWLILLLN